MAILKVCGRLEIFPEQLDCPQLVVGREFSLAVLAFLQAFEHRPLVLVERSNIDRPGAEVVHLDQVGGVAVTRPQPLTVGQVEFGDDGLALYREPAGAAWCLGAVGGYSGADLKPRGCDFRTHRLNSAVRT